MREALMQLSFSFADLQKLPKGVAAFLVGSCLAINDITIAQKVYLLGLNTARHAKLSKSDPVLDMPHAQSLVLQRSLSSKVFEYLLMAQGELKRIARSKNPNLPVFLAEAGPIIDRMCAGPAYELAKWYRNKAANHYSTTDIDALLSTGFSSDDPTSHPIYLHKMEGNSYYILGEQVLLSKLSEGGRDYLEASNEFEDWVMEASRQVSRLHSRYCIEVLEKCAPEKQMSQLQLDMSSALIGDFSASTIPLFWDGTTIPKNTTRPKK